MPTFFKMAGLLLVAGLILAAIVMYTQTSSDGTSPPQPNLEATPEELGDDFDDGAIDEEMVEDDDESLSEEADNEVMEDPEVDADQGPDLEEGELMDDSSEINEEEEQGAEAERTNP